MSELLDVRLLNILNALLVKQLPNSFYLSGEELSAKPTSSTVRKRSGQGQGQEWVKLDKLHTNGQHTHTHTYSHRSAFSA